MKKYLLLGLCLLGTTGQASETLVSSLEKTPAMGTPTTEIDDMRSKPFLVIDEKNIDQAVELILSRKYQIALITQCIKNEKMEREILDAIATVCPPCEPKWDMSQPIAWRICLSGVPHTINAPNAPVYEEFCVTKGAELTMNPDGCKKTKTITEPGEYTCSAHFQNGVTNSYPITLVSGSVIMPEDWPMERTGPVNKNDQES